MMSKLGITGMDVNASVLANSPLIAIEVEKFLTYPDRQIVPWKTNGYLTGPAYNGLAQRLGKTAEELSAILDEVRNDPNGEHERLYHPEILRDIRDCMTIERQGAVCEIKWPDQREVTGEKFVRCNFKLICPGTWPLYDLFEWNHEGK